ncbi:MAG TPA: hypothetical protein VHG33_01760, partial [Woeseiaceae bacterium]|nr:hypothetical protein [Woeseiaceae bacterium]
MSAIGRTPLPPSCLIPAGDAAVALSPVAMGTEKERRKAIPEQANPLPENCFPMRHHACPQGGSGHRQPLRGTLKPACCGDLTKVALPEPRRSNGGVPLRFPPFRSHYNAADDRTDDCAFGADDVARLRPAFRKLRFQMIADSKEHRYFSVVESRRIGPGKVAHRSVVYLGE